MLAAGLVMAARGEFRPKPVNASDQRAAAGTDGRGGGGCELESVERRQRAVGRPRRERRAGARERVQAVVRVRVLMARHEDSAQGAHQRSRGDVTRPVRVAIHA